MNCRIRWHILFISCLGMLLFASCEKELKLKSIDREPKLVINSMFAAGEDFWINVSQSLGVTTPGTLNFLSKAKVEVLNEDDVVLKVIPYVEIEGSGGNYWAEGFQPQPQAIYKLRVSHQGFTTAHSMDRVPLQVKAHFIDSITTYQQTVKALEVDLLIEDPSEERNYYLVEASRNIPMENYLAYYPLYVSTRDPLAENEVLGAERFFDRIYLPDSGFNGKEYRLKFAAETYLDEDGGYIELVVKSVSKSLYDYLFTYEQFKLYGNDPNFSSPIQVKNNIENGFGIFGAFTQQSILLELKKEIIWE